MEKTIVLTFPNTLRWYSVAMREQSCLCCCSQCCVIGQAHLYVSIDTDYNSDDESISEQFDSLFKKKMTLEKAIEGVRDDRRKLHAKHLKDFF